jgi:hypothetical protein
MAPATTPGLMAGAGAGMAAFVPNAPAAMAGASGAPMTTPLPTPGGTGGMAAAPSVMAGVGGSGGAAGAMEPAQPDPCKDFVVSRSKPCHNDPNPCNIQSGYPGDEYCILPPPAGEGIQVHFGPSSYTDKTEVAKYLIHPGDESNDYAVAPIPTTEEKFYNRVVYSMRPGSHHLINNIIAGHPTPGFVPEASGCPTERVGGLGGTQNLIYDSRPNGIVPPENEGLGYSLPPNASICFNYHRYNLTQADQLSEIWVNFYFVEEAEVTQRARWGAIIGGLGMSIAPGESEELTYSYTFSGVTSTEKSPARIIQLFGHRHAATYRFAAWLNDDLIYDSWDWRESVTYNFDSLTKNPAVMTANMLDGGHTGILPVKNGDKIKYTCFIRNETMNTLTFANELYTAEMCNLFGQAVGTSFSGLNF